MALTTVYIKKFVAETLPKEEEKAFFDSLISIANLVIYRHFNNLNSEECDDARSEATIGAIKALKKPFVDFKSHDAMHYVYTIMRHSIHNYFRKYRDKEINISPELFDSADAALNRGIKFDSTLSRLKSLYDDEYNKSCSKFALFRDYMVPFEEAIKRVNVVDTILLFRAFEQLRKDTDDNISTVRDMLEQHRD